VTDGLTLEIVEGPGAGRRLSLRGPIVIGRARDSDLTLEDGEVSRHHARVTPLEDGSVRVEDLGSANGTFVNHNELQGPARLDPGDELLIGVTVIELQLAAQPSGVRAVPPGLATTPREPTYVNPAVVQAVGRGGGGGGAADGRGGAPTLEKFLDVRVRRRAQLAPLAVFVLVALALIIYFAAR
jgi:pSer/pThr/pTyr-binding forkhead associated (FHA) protein